MIDKEIYAAIYDYSALQSVNSSTEQMFETNDKCEVFFNSTINVKDIDDLSSSNRSEGVEKSDISTLWLWYPVSSGYKAILWASSLFNSFQPGYEDPSQRQKLRRNIFIYKNFFAQKKYKIGSGNIVILFCY